MKLTIDFETRSAITELKKTGVWPYAEHPSTDVLCLALYDGKSIPRIWAPRWVLDLLGNPTVIPYQGPIPMMQGFSLPVISDQEVVTLIDQADTIEAHNAEFERALWYYVMHIRYGFPDLPFFKMRCSAAKASMHALPRALGMACAAMGVEVQKDAEGNTLMLRLCKPRAPRKAEWAALDKTYRGTVLEKAFFGLEAAYLNAPTEKLRAMCAFAAEHWAECGQMLLWNQEPGDLIRNIGYCAGDTLAEESLSDQLDDLPESEQRFWQHDQIINTRGVPIDRQMVESALRLIAQYENRLLSEMDTLTGGRVRSPKQVAAGLSWLKEQGAFLENMQKATVAKALEAVLPERAKRFLEIRQSLSRSSTAKYDAARQMLCSDGRIRGIAMYHGAGTGRFTHKGVQLGNLPRGIFDMEKEAGIAAFERAISLVKAGDLDLLIMEFGDPMEILSSVIRPIVCAEEGKEFHCADFSAIEGRGLAWLAGEQWVLDVYGAYDRGEGPDMYMVTAAKILNKDAADVTKKERKSPGKIANLACGYNGGPAAIAVFGGKCPEEQRTEFIHSVMYDKIPAEREDARQWFSGRVSPTVSSEDEYRSLGEFGFPFPTEDEIFEKWARDVVTKWRQAHPNIVAFWRGLEAAALEAVQHGIGSYRNVTYYMSECGRFLKCRLPSGRDLYYPFPEVRYRTMPWGETKLCLSHMNVDGTTKKWVRRFVHGGVLAENCTQAICRDLLVESMYRLELAGYPIILHVHDETAGELTQAVGSLQEFEQIMAEVPAWAVGFPISVKGWTGRRFKKD